MASVALLVRVSVTLSLSAPGAAKLEDLGEQFGEFLTQREVEYLRKNEFAMEADDIIWRRTKLGLKMSEQDVKRLSKYLKTS